MRDAVLAFEGLVLLMLVREVAGSRHGLFVALVVGLCAAFLPNGYLIGTLLGVVLWHAGGTDPKIKGHAVG